MNEHEKALPAGGPAKPTQNAVKIYVISSRERLLLPLAFCFCLLLVNTLLWSGPTAGLTASVCVWYGLLGLYLGRTLLNTWESRVLLAVNLALAATLALGSNWYFRAWNLLALLALLPVHAIGLSGGQFLPWWRPSMLWERLCLLLWGLFGHLGAALATAWPQKKDGAARRVLPLLLGALTGSVVAGIFFAAGTNLFREVPAAALDASLWKLGDGSIFAVPAFSLPKVSWTAVAAIMPIAIATIPESTAHMYQLDIYVNDVAKRKGSKKKYDLIGLLDRNLIGDGICDMISGVVGGPAGTNYGENISTMAITKVFSVPVLAVAAVIAMIVSFFTPLIRVIYGIPLAVIGGLEVYLFGAIAAQGIAIMIEKKVDMFSSKNIAVIASIMVIGIGGQYAFGGNIPFFGLQVPCIAGAAIFGIVLNLLLSIGEKKAKAEKE